MKIRQILMNSLLAGTLVISQSLFLSGQEPAKAQSTRPYIVLVNGYLNCCAWSVAGSLPQNAEIRAVPYSNFSDGGSSGDTSDDSAFLRDGADFINNQLDRNRPLILIGHSFGGDSVLKLLPQINRRIQFVAVVDPVRTGGFRSSLKALNVPSNVDYFFNRWQENVPFPNDFGISGSIPCNAGTCDQDSQNIARNADFSPVTTQCRWDEVTCPGFVAPNPFIGRKGRKGTKQVRVSHQDLPKDAFIQKDLGNKIQRQISAFQPPVQNLEAQQKIIGFYRDFLSREPRPDEIDFRMDAFRKGYPLERQRTDLAFGDEVRQKIIDFYKQYLGRDPESGAVESRMNALLNGRTLEQQRMDIQGR